MSYKNITITQPDHSHGGTNEYEVPYEVKPGVFENFKVVIFNCIITTRFVDPLNRDQKLDLTNLIAGEGALVTTHPNSENMAQLSFGGLTALGRHKPWGKCTASILAGGTVHTTSTTHREENYIVMANVQRVLSRDIGKYVVAENGMNIKNAVARLQLNFPLDEVLCRDEFGDQHFFHDKEKINNMRMPLVARRRDTNDNDDEDGDFKCTIQCYMNGAVVILGSQSVEELGFWVAEIVVRLARAHGWEWGVGVRGGDKPTEIKYITH